MFLPVFFILNTYFWLEFCLLYKSKSSRALNGKNYFWLKIFLSGKRTLILWDITLKHIFSIWSCWKQNINHVKYYKQENLFWNNQVYTLAEKCSNTELILVRIFPHSDWIRRDTKYSVRMWENTDQKQLHISTLFMQWYSMKTNSWRLSKK